ncbi:metallo-beta-lactamase domain-containing protein 1-like isoform X2 [Littorina saxatilis]|uniref:Metallo-beta-lactamase domain-containing protein 1 n=1 Tax=Littorina saxatilis TaxID=31220 RepID=A0AAN9G0D9_9CAEN
MYEVIVLKEGYTKPVQKGHFKAGGSVTLLKGPQNIVVDTGSPWDRELLLNGLKANGLSPDLINYVICSHGHSDHVGNLNLFQNSVHIVSYDICKGDQYIMHDFIEGIPYEIDENVEIWPTPGHTGADVSVIVRGTKHGTVAVAGDLFECFEDLEEPELWQNSSEQPEQQQQSRFDVLRVADAIVPGHGAMFQVPAEYRKQMRMVMMQEERYMEECGEGASVHASFRSECVIVETD